ncbi:DUF2497 domain-containing protein [Reyranella sp. CPCC 100927]|uniref:DUF2497 domain-containing protein n=1 Tax=Reyranella sp. CPCC 100927 TaxID=2599616 RepID=UPI0011B5C9EF|nr:DUF2497 domain-containing protein [Reyranella sp. CPCC 100927]TWT10643.1 DUF2497 domain-containing protein [Reyranella sp. CPCC 100927]
MADGKPHQDPSMDDILSSIRRIIQEDGSRQADAAVKPSVAAKGDTMASPPPRPAAAAVRQDDVLLLTDLVDDPDAARGAAPAPATARALASNPISSAMDRLARAVEAASPPVVAETPAPVASAGGPTLEDVVKDALRPMLQAWLDKNLPELVERIVEREVQRLTQR